METLTILDKLAKIDFPALDGDERVNAFRRVALSLLLAHGAPADRREITAALRGRPAPQTLAKDADGRLLPPPGFRPEMWQSDAQEGWSKRYDVECPHFGKFLSAGGCSCGSGNAHECALDGTTKRSACQKCFHNRAPQYARLIVAEGCPDCAELKVALLERIGAERVKEILLNRNGKVRCLHYDEDGGKPHFDRDTNMSHVPSIRAELTRAHYPADVFAPLLLLPDGELLTRPAEIAAKIAELSA